MGSVKKSQCEPIGPGGPEQRRNRFVRLRHPALTIGRPRHAFIDPTCFRLAYRQCTYGHGPRHGRQLKRRRTWSRSHGRTGEDCTGQRCAHISQSQCAGRARAWCRQYSSRSRAQRARQHHGTSHLGSSATTGGTRGERRAASAKAASRPGVAQSPNSDGYAECIAMMPATGDTASRESWSATCNRARLPRKSP